jgi:hypothetical protein
MEHSAEAKLFETLNLIAGTLAVIAAEIHALRAAQNDPSQARADITEHIGDRLIEAEKIGHRIGENFLMNISPSSSR